MRELRQKYKKQIEAILFVSDKPISSKEIAKILDMDDKEVEELLEELKKEYEERGINIYKINDGYEFATSPDTADAIWRYTSKGTERLSRSALEVLAIIYYHQPVTKAEIEAIKGTKVDGILSNLLERKLIKIVGRKETIGRPFIYGIGEEFFRYFIIEDKKELEEKIKK
uniref:SMC-Scp complex subunit ScpB n=1 Tax=Dictyoglomus turgidum TaxID=513050 RepID=A0A7C3WUJ9_9BACT